MRVALPLAIPTHHGAGVDVDNATHVPPGSGESQMRTKWSREPKMVPRALSLKKLSRAAQPGARHSRDGGHVLERTNAIPICAESETVGSVVLDKAST